MSNDSTFFGDVFDDPKEDPLLGEEATSADAMSDPSYSEDRPTWSSEGERANGTTSSSDPDRNDACRKQIVVDQRRDEAKGIDALNQAVGEGWRLVRLSLDRPTGEQFATRKAAHRFVAVLEQEQPRSLFDFGCAS